MDTGWASSWVLLSIPLRLQHTLRHLRCDWDGWHSSLGFLGARRLCRSARVQWRWQILVVQDLALSWQRWHPSFPSLLTCAPQEVQATAVPGVALLSEVSVSPVGS